MNIAIVGCGKVGSAIASRLTAEGHNITVIDIDSEKVRKLTEELDVMGVVGNGSSLSLLSDIGIENIDIFIAVTGFDEQNLLSCMFARKTGDCQTIARIHNPVYAKEAEFICQQMDISAVINQDQQAAKEISRLLRFPSATQIDTFSDDRVRLVKFELQENSAIAGKPLKDLSDFIGKDVRICSVERNGEVEIANGSTVLMPKDLVTYIAPREKTVDFLEKLDMATKPVKNAMLIGASSICYYLTEDLLNRGIDVDIIEKDPAKCAQFAEAFPKAVVIEGDGTDRSFLLSQGLNTAEAVVSLTSIDEENVLLSLYAKKHCSGKIVTKVNRLDSDEIIKSLDLGSVVYPKFITCDYIIQYVRAMKNHAGNNLKTLYHILDDRLEALEFNVAEASEVTGVPISSLKLKGNHLLCCITRGNKIIIPTGSDSIMVGDNVIVVTAEQGLHDITDILA